MKKRVTGIMLVLGMLLTLVPVGAWADDASGTAAAASVPFTDVASDSWYYSNVAYVYSNGIFSGTDATTFSPDQTMTRGMLVTVLNRIAGSPVVDYAMNFSDVSGDEWYGEAVRWAASEKLVTGYGDGSFRPDEMVTREQMAAILYRYAESRGYDTTQGGMAIREFSDYDSISGYALTPLDWTVNAGLMNGSDNALRPQDGAQRSQVAAVLQRFMQNIVKQQ